MTRATPADLAHLVGLYADTDDPWAFRSSAYEAWRMEAVVRCLPRRRYGAALELGCGNGELARRVAPLCDAYTGLDAVPAALAAARAAVPEGRFVEAFLPCDLPEPVMGGTYDLVLLSEVLYFLDSGAIGGLARDLDRDHPEADVVTVTWRGSTSHALDGDAASATFREATARAVVEERVTPRCRIVAYAPNARRRPNVPAHAVEP